MTDTTTVWTKREYDIRGFKNTQYLVCYAEANKSKVALVVLEDSRTSQLTVMPLSEFGHEATQTNRKHY